VLVLSLSSSTNGSAKFVARTTTVAGATKGVVGAGVVVDTRVDVCVVFVDVTGIVVGAAFVVGTVVVVSSLVVVGAVVVVGAGVVVGVGVVTEMEVVSTLKAEKLLRPKHF